MNKRIISITVLLSILFAAFSLHISADNLAASTEALDLYPAYEFAYVQANIESLVDIDKLCEIARLRSLEYDPLSIGSVKRMSDFNGYTYYIVEFEPIGYAIYDNRFTQVLEFNAQAESPYQNYTENLVYAGAGEYYIKSDETVQSYDVYNHVVHGSSLIMDAETEAFYKQQSSYVSNNVAMAANAKLSSQIVDKHNIESSSYAALMEYEVITGANTSGFNTGNENRCGFVAGSLVVWYYYKAKGWNDFVPGGVYSEDLVDAIQGTYGGETLGPALKQALSNWSNYHGATFENLLPAVYQLLPSSSQIFGLIEDDRPVVLLGMTPAQSDIVIDGTNSLNGIESTMGEIAHAITITGVVHEDGEYYYFAHFGWGTAYNDIYIADASLTKGSIVYY